jgi:hypothetical protein
MPLFVPTFMDNVDTYSYPNPYNDPTLPGYRPKTTNIRESSSSFVTAETKIMLLVLLKLIAMLYEYLSAILQKMYKLQSKLKNIYNSTEK